MPSFPNLDAQTVSALVDYLRTPAKPAGQEKEMHSDAAAPAPNAAQENTAGARLYQDRCGICHGEHMEGIAPAIPMLTAIGSRMSAPQITGLIHNGKGAMPGQADIEGADLSALLSYLGVGPNPQPAAPNAAAAATPEYVFTGYRKFLDPEGYPAFNPPWGTLNAIDLNTGKYLWKINLGELPELAAQGMTNTGSENYGGPIVTAGGVLFIGATTHDRKFRAFDAATGKLLWENSLPYGGNATPATYMIDGKQYVVIGASGARDPKTPQGSAYVAFTLP